MILILTSKKDGHVGSVTRYFDKNCIKWIRINVEDTAKNLEFHIHPTDREGIIRICDSQRTLNLSQVKSVWYRKPTPVHIEHFELSEPGLRYVEAEFNEILMGLYGLLGECLWVNNPFKTRISHRKLKQLSVAKQIGFTVPNTIVSNIETEVLSFAKAYDWDIAIKSLGAISVMSPREEDFKQYGVFTRRLTKEELIKTQGRIKYMPTIYQEYIKKKFELRITCVGKTVFACKIESQDNPLTKEDIRFKVQSLKHEPFDSSEINEMLLEYLKHFGLNFGCFDIAVDQNNNYVFFECNPNGQWLWIEKKTGMPISKATADLLMSNINSTC